MKFVQQGQFILWILHVSIPKRYEIVGRSVLKNWNGEIGIPMTLPVFVDSYRLVVARTLIDAKNT